jgi:uncharacterized protein (TIGR03435 family)
MTDEALQTWDERRASRCRVLRSSFHERTAVPWPGPVPTIDEPGRQVAESDARLRFDVASIRLCAANASGGRWVGTALPGRLRIDCQSFFQLMRTAYQVFADGRVNTPGTYPTFEPDLGSRKAPDWTGVMRFTIEAVTARTPPPPAVMRGPMLQTLLEERFKLKIRRETREMAVDELIVSKGGANLKPLQPGTCVPYDSSVYPQPALEPGQRQCRNISSERDASGTAWIKRPRR